MIACSITRSGVNSSAIRPLCETKKRPDRLISGRYDEITVRPRGDRDAQMRATVGKKERPGHRDRQVDASADDRQFQRKAGIPGVDMFCTNAPMLPAVAEYREQDEHRSCDDQDDPSLAEPSLACIAHFLPLKAPTPAKRRRARPLCPASNSRTDGASALSSGLLRRLPEPPPLPRRRPSLGPRRRLCWRVRAPTARTRIQV